MALACIAVGRLLQEECREYILSKQLIRSGTNPGAMVCESRHAASTRDFLHKLRIGKQETEESLYWLRLIRKSNYLPAPKLAVADDLCDQVLRLLTAIIKTLSAKLEQE